MVYHTAEEVAINYAAGVKYRVRGNARTRNVSGTYECAAYDHAIGIKYEMEDPKRRGDGFEIVQAAMSRDGHHAGRWTREEHEAFLMGLKLYGREWKRVAQNIKTRTSAQIRSHAQKFFNRLNKEAKDGRELYGRRGGRGGREGDTGSDPEAIQERVVATLHALMQRREALVAEMEMSDSSHSSFEQPGSEDGSVSSANGYEDEKEGQQLPKFPLTTHLHAARRWQQEQSARSRGHQHEEEYRPYVEPGSRRRGHPDARRYSPDHCSSGPTPEHRPRSSPGPFLANPQMQQQDRRHVAPQDGGWQRGSGRQYVARHGVHGVYGEEEHREYGSDSAWSDQHGAVAGSGQHSRWPTEGPADGHCGPHGSYEASGAQSVPLPAGQRFEPMSPRTRQNRLQKLEEGELIALQALVGGKMARPRQDPPLLDVKQEYVEANREPTLAGIAPEDTAAPPAKRQRTTADLWGGETANSMESATNTTWRHETTVVL